MGVRVGKQDGRHSGAFLGRSRNYQLLARGSVCVYIYIYTHSIGYECFLTKESPAM